MTTFIGQNMGAGKPERAREGTKLAYLAVVVETVVVCVPIYFFADKLVGLFGKDPEMIAYGVGFLTTIMPVYLIMGTQMLFGGIIRGYGYSIQAMIFSILGMVAVRQIWLAVSMSISHTVTNIYLGYPLGWTATAISMLLFYFIKIRPQTMKAKETL
jgi:Na+-driven multidrug efflux pump